MKHFVVHVLIKVWSQYGRILVPESSKEVSNKDEISQCTYCGEYGFTTDFYKDGRFCSQTCIRAFESK